MDPKDKKLADRAMRVLAQNFKGCKIELEKVGPRLFGSLSWSGFEGLEQVERQRLMWEVLDSVLSPADARRIMLLTFIPEELTVGHEDI